MTFKPTDKRPAFQQGDRVQWRTFGDVFHGCVCHVYTSETCEVVDCQQHTQDADLNNPAYLIELDDGKRTLKRHTEVFAEEDNFD